jgi:hypothetical protein
MKAGLLDDDEFFDDDFGDDFIEIVWLKREKHVVNQDSSRFSRSDHFQHALVVDVCQQRLALG